MKRIWILLIIAVCAAVAAFFCACEVDSASGEVVISPSSAVLKKGESIQFTASGGYEYRWSLKNEEWGMLSSRRGPLTVYTSLYDPRDCTGCKPEQGAVQILYAESYIPASLTAGGKAGGASNATMDVLMTGEAYITHLTDVSYTNE
jgi:hypothetical protein